MPDKQVKDVSDIQAEVGRDRLLPTLASIVVPIEPEQKSAWVQALSSAVISSSQLGALKLQPLHETEILSDNFGHEVCIILRKSRKALVRPLSL